MLKKIITIISAVNIIAVLACGVLAAISDDKIQEKPTGDDMVTGIVPEQAGNAAGKIDGEAAGKRDGEAAGKIDGAKVGAAEGKKNGAEYWCRTRGLSTTNALQVADDKVHYYQPYYLGLAEGCPCNKGKTEGTHAGHDPFQRGYREKAATLNPYGYDEIDPWGAYTAKNAGIDAVNMNHKEAAYNEGYADGQVVGAAATDGVACRDIDTAQPPARTAEEIDSIFKSL